MKRLTFVAMVLLFLLVAVSFSFANTSEIELYLNDEKVSFNDQPQLSNDRVYVPLRGIFEAFEAQVEWNDATQTVTAVKGDTEIKVTIGSKSAKKNGTNIMLEAVPYLSQKRTYVPLRFVGEAFGAHVNWDGNTKAISIVTAGDLPVVGSFETLKKLLKENADMRQSYLYNGINEAVSDAAVKSVDRVELKSEAASSPEHSETNVQVQGVDEADIVKTDGEYLYQVSNQQIVISRIFPADELEVRNVIGFEPRGDTSGFMPAELYIDDDYLIVIGTAYYRHEDITVDKPSMARPEVYPPVNINNSIKIIVFDRTDRENPNQVREIEVEGNYLSSRKVGSSLYLVSNKYFGGYQIMGTETEYVPALRYRDNESSFTEMPYSKIHYFPKAISPNYLTVVAVNLDKPNEKANISTFLGAGENIYASPEHLYVALTEYEAAETKPAVLPLEQQKMIAPPVPLQNNETTAIHKFALLNGNMVYQGKGKVSGHILNQFSMDEYNGHFRIATTSGSLFGQGQNQSSNNIYVLDGKMNTVGKIEDIAPGERIYSARFMGERGYLVTFKKVDPLFVLDLKDPDSPKILGKLKIPGYSDYLHPYGENYIIGFGKDAMETADERFGDGVSMAFYQGMKIALFDITDVNNPIELHKEIIGDRGTDSELLHNHKALLFDKERNLLAFPVTVMEINKQQENTGSWPQYGEFSFQGAYVYNLDIENGFNLQGRITHLNSQDFQKTGYYYNNNKNVKRIFFVEDNLYTVSDGMVKANRISNLEEIDSLNI